MSYVENLWVFFTLLFGIIVMPGVDMLFVLSSSLTAGRRAGLTAAAGIVAGGGVHSLYGAAGVAVLATFANWLLTPLVLVGAAYLALIGLGLAECPMSVSTVDAAAARSRWTTFRQGLVTCLLNPKAYAFMLAVYPQFLKRQYGSLWTQAMIMAAMTALTQFFVYGLVAIAAGQSRDLLMTRTRDIRLLGRSVGVLMLVVAGVMAWRALANLGYGGYGDSAMICCRIDRPHLIAL
jgi:threonine/homoserine/homoserine lactone efflux protein